MSAERATYLDSSAIVKLAVAEAESVALRSHLRRRGSLVSSALARTEVTRALRHLGESAVGRGDSVLALVELLRVGDRVLRAAAVLGPADLRSLDAIHLASAQQFGKALRHVVTYDVRMADVARSLGMKVVSPGW